MKKIIWSVILLTLLVFAGCQKQITTQNNNTKQNMTQNNFQIIKSVITN